MDAYNKATDPHSTNRLNNYLFNLHSNYLLSAKRKKKILSIPNQIAEGNVLQLLFFNFK